MNVRAAHVLWGLTLAVGGVLGWRATASTRQPDAVAYGAEQGAQGESLEERLLAGPVQPLPLRVRLDARKVGLGERLFHEPRLSGDGSISCASCHDLSRGGADGRPVSTGIAGRLGELNAPTVLNSAYSFRQFWDGRVGTLEEQVPVPIHNPTEMGSTWAQVTGFLRSDEAYRKAFEAIYPDGVSPEAVADAIATYERSLTTPNAPFDRYLRGLPNALDAQQERGYDLFLRVGCVTCHQGVNLGGNMFQKLGKVHDFFADRGRIEERDLGRFNVTGREEDKHLFKVPTLRNVELTAPYLHDGSVHTLEDVVRLMAHYELGVRLEPAEIADVTAFLHALTGEQPAVKR